MKEDDKKLQWYHEIMHAMKKKCFKQERNL